MSPDFLMCILCMAISETLFMCFCSAELTPNDGDYSGGSVVFKNLMHEASRCERGRYFHLSEVFPCCISLNLVLFSRMSDLGAVFLLKLACCFIICSYQSGWSESWSSINSITLDFLSFILQSRVSLCLIAQLVAVQDKLESRSKLGRKCNHHFPSLAKNRRSAVVHYLKICSVTSQERYG